MKSDTTEKGLETLIMRHMTGVDGFSGVESENLAERPHPNGAGWIAGDRSAYDREYAVDVEQLFRFLRETQPEEFAKLGIGNFKDSQGMARQKFLARLQGEITRRGVIDVLRHGIKHGALSFDLFYGTPSPERMPRRWSVMRRTASASRGNCTSAETTSARWICAPSSTVCR